jgi:hypothetical protein
MHHTYTADIYIYIYVVLFCMWAEPYNKRPKVKSVNCETFRRGGLKHSFRKSYPVAGKLSDVVSAFGLKRIGAGRACQAGTSTSSRVETLCLTLALQRNVDTASFVEIIMMFSGGGVYAPKIIID